MSLRGNTDQEKLDDLCTKTYKEQAVWFLNAFWKTIGNKEAPNVFLYKHKMDEIDIEKGKEGNQLDELNAHRFLEGLKETLTVSAMRQKLAQAGVDKNTKRKYVPLTHYLIFKYNVDLNTLVNASQGDNQEEVAQAQRMLEAVQASFAEAEARAQEAKRSEAEAKRAEAAAKQAQIELEAALKELKAQEDAFNNTTKELERKSEEGGQVSRNRAKNELAQHLSSDPLPLRKAKTTMEAAVRKAERATKEAEEATAAAKQARAAAEAAVDDAARKVEEAEAFLEKVKSKPGSAQGALWWIDQELAEAKKYLPTSRGGVARK